VSFTIFIVGHIIASMQLTVMEQRLEQLQHQLDAGGN